MEKHDLHAKTRAKLIFFVLILIAQALIAQSISAKQHSEPNRAADLMIKGEVKQELQMTLADLKTFARTKVTAKDHDGKTHEYEGVALQTILGKAGVPQSAEMRGKNMTLYVVAEASDGYRVVFSLTELDNDFAAETVLLADTADGQPLTEEQGPLRLVVPNDKRQGRWVRMLKILTVRDAGK